MSFARTAVSSAALCLMLAATGSYAADASVPATSASCLHMSKKVSAALDANASSPNADTARTESNLGRDFCASHFYDKGLNHYAKALQILGAG